MTATGRKPHAHPDAELTVAQLEQLANFLQKTRHELADKLAALREQIALKEDCSISDAAEAASLKEQSARAAGVAEQHNRTLAEIDRALTKLENGRYGISEVSGEPIAYERLKLVPWARSGADD